MAYTGLLRVEGTSYRVRSCSYSLRQNVDENGRPASQIIGGTINLEIEASDDSTILEWMVDRIEKKSGQVEFENTMEEGTLKTIEFDDAYLVSYRESMDAISNKPMVEALVISAKKLSIQGVSFENVWESKL